MDAEQCLTANRDRAALGLLSPLRASVPEQIERRGRLPWSVAIEIGEPEDVDATAFGVSVSRAGIRSYGGGGGDEYGGDDDGREVHFQNLSGGCRLWVLIVWICV